MSKTVIITGAAGNLGSAVTKEFLDKGYHVIATVANTPLSVGLQHPELETVKVGLTDEKWVADFIQQVITRHKRIDAALMLVGGYESGTLGQTRGDDVKKQIALNFETAYYVARPLLAHMLQNNAGRLVFVSARPGLNAKAARNNIAYALSKSLIIRLAEYINEEAKGKNVSATVFIPSTIDTPQNRKSMPEANADEWVMPEQIAALMEMVCSETGAPLRETILKVYNNA